MSAVSTMIQATTRGSAIKPACPHTIKR